MLKSIGRTFNFQFYAHQTALTLQRLGQILIGKLKRREKMVGDTGLEPVTSAMSRQRSNQLS